MWAIAAVHGYIVEDRPYYCYGSILAVAKENKFFRLSAGFSQIIMRGSHHADTQASHQVRYAGGGWGLVAV
jgi:hypothetical protein